MNSPCSSFPQWARICSKFFAEKSPRSATKIKRRILNFSRMRLTISTRVAPSNIFPGYTSNPSGIPSVSTSNPNTTCVQSLRISLEYPKRHNSPRSSLVLSNRNVVLYDLTTLRFESTREDLGELCRFGYSKEMRSDCTQVVLGLLVDTDGIPLGFEVYPGNTFEGATLVDIVKRMREKFKIRRFIFVADRGLFSAKNLEHIRAHCGDEEKGEFIVGMKLGVIKQRHDEFYDRSRFTKMNDELECYETTHNGDRCIITWSKKRAERDRETREDILSKIRKKLTKKSTPKNFVSNTNYRKYVTGLK